MIHELKTDPAVFQAIVAGLKTWELRKNDRDFKVDDMLLLKETAHTGAEIAAGASPGYTGRIIAVRVTYILHGPAYGLVEGWCIMSVIRDRSIHRVVGRTIRTSQF